MHLTEHPTDVNLIQQGSSAQTLQLGNVIHSWKGQAEGTVRIGLFLVINGEVCEWTMGFSLNGPNRPHTYFLPQCTHPHH